MYGFIVDEIRYRRKRQHTVEFSSLNFKDSKANLISGTEMIHVEARVDIILKESSL